MINDKTTNISETDVLVIGAGPIGLTVACLMADQGLEVTVVEKAPSTSDLPRAISATDETLRIMQEIGVLDDLKSEMLMNTGARYFGRNDQLLAEVNPGRNLLGQPAKSQFDQPVMEKLLHQAASKRSNIDLRFNTEAFTIAQDASHATTTLIDKTGKKSVKSKWVIAADGGRSPIRAQMGITLTGSTQVQKWIVLDIVDSKIKPEPFSEFHCNGKRPVVIVPGVGGRRRYEFMLLEDESDAEVTKPEFIIDLVSPYEQVLESQIRRAAVYVAHQRIATEYRRGRVLLIGDAAHLMPPFAGQALNAGTRDAANIAWKLAAVIKSGAPDSLIDTYEEERRPHAAEMVRLSHLIGKVVMATGSKKTALRDSAIEATRIAPRFRSWITEMRFLKQPHYSSGVLLPAGKDLNPALKALVGSSIPQPSLFSEGAHIPLDNLLGNGWAVVRIQGEMHIEVEDLESGSVSVGTDSSGLISHLPKGMSLIIRPDRYVAAAVSTANEVTALIQLGQKDPQLLSSPTFSN